MLTVLSSLTICLLDLKELRWNEFEMPYNSPPFFHAWFSKHCRDKVAKYMLKEVREKAGLGSPPAPYYTNDVESKNKLLKDTVQYKSSQLPEFIEKMKSLMTEQKREIERAIVGSGEYRLRKEYQNLSVESSRWFKMSTQQRQRKIDRFMKAAVQDDFDQPSDCSCPLDVLSLPPHLKTSLWEKANDLVNDEAAIVRAPGDADECAWMVKSYSGKRPHFVKASKCGFSCDEQCMSFKSMKLCSHTIALAIKKDCVDKFLRWYRTMKYQPNFTTIAEAGKPSTAGKKPARKGVSKKSAEHIRRVLTGAEESHSEWQARGSHSDCRVGVEDAQDRVSFASEEMFGHPRASIQDPLHPATTTTVVMSQSDVHSINIGGVGGIVSGPPPLIPAEFGQSPPRSSSMAPPGCAATVSPQMRPGVDSPFWLVFIFGNVSRCNGCKGRIVRDANKKPLPPPDDIILGHKEYIVFHNPRSGNFEQSREQRNVYYHPWRTCIAPHFFNFDAQQHIMITDPVKAKLTSMHKDFLLREFGVVV